MKYRYSLLALALIIGGFWGYEKLVDGFYESAIELHTWPEKCYQENKPSHHVQEILNQPFTYLGKGRQFFVFESSDKNYVLKFVKCQRIDLPAYLPASKERLQQRQDRIEGIFASVDLAAHSFQKTTAVVYCKLFPRDMTEQKITIIDKLGRTHNVALEGVPFVLQKKAKPILTCFEECLALDDNAGAKRRIDQLIDLFQTDRALSCYDKDSGTILRNNVGFLADAAIHIDIGTLSKEHVDISEDKKRLEPLAAWLKERSPELANYLHSKITNDL